LSGIETLQLHFKGMFMLLMAAGDSLRG